MKTTIPIHIDTADLTRLRDQMKDQVKDQLSDLSKMELPKLEGVGRTADETIDRLLGRSRMRVWPWVASAVGLVAIVGAVSAAFMWLRRPAMTNSTAAPLGTPEMSAFTDEPLTAGTTSLDDTGADSSTYGSDSMSQPQSERIFRGDEVV
jgi:hypothetical protein